MFYKQITDFIYKRQFIYHGPATEFDGYYATAPANGGDAHLVGGEFDFSRRSTSLRASGTGLGFDVELDASVPEAAVSDGHRDDCRDARQPDRALRTTAAPVEAASATLR